MWLLFACSQPSSAPPSPAAVEAVAPAPLPSPPPEPGETKTGPPAELDAPAPDESRPALGVGVLVVENLRDHPVLVDCGHTGQYPAVPLAKTEVPIALRPAICVVYDAGEEVTRWELVAEPAPEREWALRVPR